MQGQMAIGGGGQKQHQLAPGGAPGQAGQPRHAQHIDMIGLARLCQNGAREEIIAETAALQP